MRAHAVCRSVFVSGIYFVIEKKNNFSLYNLFFARNKGNKKRRKKKVRRLYHIFQRNETYLSHTLFFLCLSRRSVNLTFTAAAQANLFLFFTRIAKLFFIFRLFFLFNLLLLHSHIYLCIYILYTINLTPILHRIHVYHGVRMLYYTYIYVYYYYVFLLLHICLK